MPSFGDYETVGEPVAITEERDYVSTVWQAHKSGDHGTPRYAVKLFAPRRSAKPRDTQDGDALEQDPALIYIEGIKELLKIPEADSFLAPIRAFGVAAEGAWQVLDLYPRSLKTWIGLRGRVDGAAVQHIVSSLVAACLALKKHRGYSHGNLKTGNVFLVGRPQALRSTPVHLADAGHAGLIDLPAQKSGPSGVAPAELPEFVERRDLQRLGELILQLVEGRLISTAFEYNYPIARSAAWDSLGKEGERWREICNRLLDPQLSLDTLNLETLGSQIKQVSNLAPLLARLPVLAAAAGAVGLVAIICYFATRQKVPVLLSQPKNLTSVVRSNAVFHAAAKGRGLRYQWFKDGRGLAGMTNPVLEFKSLAFENEGGYYIIVTNWAGGVTSAPAELAVAATTLTLTAGRQERYYGDPNPTLTNSITGLRPGDAITVKCLTSADITSPVGEYDVTPIAVDQNGELHNYLIITNHGTLIVKQAPLTIKTFDQSRTYGDPDPVFQGKVDGLKSNDDIRFTFSSVASVNSSVGRYDIKFSYEDQANRLANYSLTLFTGKLRVDPAPLTVTVHNQERIYGDTNPPLTAEFSGLRCDDHIAASGYSAATINSRVGGYVINPLLADPAGRLANYSVKTNVGTLTIKPAPLTVTSFPTNRAYGAPLPALSGDLSGVRAGDNISISFNTPALEDSQVGLYEILPKFDDPEKRLANYIVTTNLGQLTVANSPMTVTADNAMRIYGGDNPYLTGNLNGIRRGDRISATYDTIARSAAEVGDYKIFPVFHDPESRLQNYTITTNLGTLVVTQAILTAVAGNSTRAYGQGNPQLTGQSFGICSGDDIAISFRTMAREDTPVGSYAIFPILTGDKLPNYNVKTKNGILTVTKAVLTVSVDNYQRAYGENSPPFTGRLSGVRPGDEIKTSFYTLAQNDTVVGNYAILPRLDDPAFCLTNYIVKTNAGTLTITQAMLTVKLLDQKREYGKGNPPLRVDVKGLRGTGGFGNWFRPGKGDNITVDYWVDADSNSPVNVYPMQPIFHDPDHRLSNYTISTNFGKLTITRQRVTLAPNAQNREQSEAARSLSGIVYGIRMSDDITVTFQSIPDNPSQPGQYQIVPVFHDPDTRLGNYELYTNRVYLTILPPRP